MTPRLRVKRLRANVALPAYATSGAAGLDLRAAIDEAIELDPGATLKVPTGIAIELPTSHEGQVRPRSGLAARHGITVLNSPGTIDEDYRGEIAVLLVNLGSERYIIEAGARIAQLVVAPVQRVEIREISVDDELATTERGPGGFGSTGVS